MNSNKTNVTDLILCDNFRFKTEMVNGKNIIVCFIGSAQLLGSSTCKKAVNNLALRIPHNNNNIKKKTRQRFTSNYTLNNQLIFISRS